MGIVSQPLGFISSPGTPFSAARQISTMSVSTPPCAPPMRQVKPLRRASRRAASPRMALTVSFKTILPRRRVIAPVNPLTGGSVTNNTSNIFEAGFIVDGQGLALIMQAINNIQGVSLLSAPNVTTLSGLKASIDIVQEFPYPTSFEKPKLSNSSNLAYSAGANANEALELAIPPTPREFVTQDVGVSLEVKPTTYPDQRIDLDITKAQGARLRRLHRLRRAHRYQPAARPDWNADSWRHQPARLQPALHGNGSASHGWADRRARRPCERGHPGSQ